MSVDPRWLSDLAAQTGFRAETLEKVIRLGEVAGDITRHPLLSSALVLLASFGSPPSPSATIGRRS